MNKIIKESWLKSAKTGFKIGMTIAILMTLVRITIIHKELREINSKIDRVIMFLNLDLDADKETENEAEAYLLYLRNK